MNYIYLQALEPLLDSGMTIPSMDTHAELAVLFTLCVSVFSASYHDYTALTNHLQQMADMYSQYTYLYTIGTSVQGKCYAICHKTGMTKIKNEPQAEGLTNFDPK